MKYVNSLTLICKHDERIILLATSYLHIPEKLQTTAQLSEVTIADLSFSINGLEFEIENEMRDTKMAVS